MTDLVNVPFEVIHPLEMQTVMFYKPCEEGSNSKACASFSYDIPKIIDHDLKIEVLDDISQKTGCTYMLYYNQLKKEM